MAAHYDRLSALDNTFLANETPTVPMHVSAIEIFEAGPLRTENGGIDIEKIRAAYESVLHLIPRYRQKLMWIPIEDHPVWIDDPDFNLDYHVRHVSLPRPGGVAELKKVASRVMANHLDRRRPLWEVWVVEGLEPDRFALIAKTHHCMLDGSSGVEMAQILLRRTPETEVEEPKLYLPRAAPTPAELLRDEALRYASLPLRALRSFREFREEVEDIGAELNVRASALRDFFDASVSRSSDTPLNAPLGPHRRFDWLTLSLADMKAVRKQLDCTINDVVLATVTHAYREFLRGRQVDVDQLVFRASTPVSVRRENEKHQMGNRVSTWIVDLPLNEPDRLAQLDRIRAETQRLKESRQALGMDMLMAAADWAPSGILSLGAGLASVAVNTIVTNVPGPQFPLYTLGAKLVAMIPEVPLLENIGLGIALMSYDGRVFWGFTADYDLVPDLAHFVDLVARSFAGLADAAGVSVSGGEDEQTSPRPELLPPADAASHS